MNNKGSFFKYDEVIMMIMAWSNLAFFYLTTPFPKLSPHNIQRVVSYSFRLISLTLLVADLLSTLDTPVGKTSTQVAAILGFEHILWWIGDAFIDAFDWKKVSVLKNFFGFYKVTCHLNLLFVNYMYQFLRFFFVGSLLSGLLMTKYFY